MGAPEVIMMTGKENLEVSKEKDHTKNIISENKAQDKIYSYDEAIELAGNGFYIFSMLAVLACAFAGMSLDLFGFAIVVSSACDLNLTHAQTNILLSMPYAGPIVSAYPWGYISDTQGRLRGLLLCLWGSFILATMSVLSPNWIFLAVLKFGSAACSGGIQSLSFAYLGESCSPKYRGTYLIGIVIIIVYSFAIYSFYGYFILNLEFSLDLGFVTFTPWRLLALILAIPLGIAATCLSFYYESPKFLLNNGDEKKALNILKKISKGNGVKTEDYPVKSVVLKETTTRLREKDVPFMKSLMDQIVPLFQLPLLYRTLQLFFITTVIYSNNGFLSFLPVVADSFFSGYSVNGTVIADNLCGMLTYANSNVSNSNTCISNVNKYTIWIGLIQGIAYSILNIIVSFCASRKKIVLMVILLTNAICGFSTPLAHGRILTIFLFFGFLINTLAMGVIFSYYVDIFPTSYRGMASCLGVMVSRISGLVGTNLVGTYLVSNCANSFYSWSAYFLSGVIMCSFLPPDKPKTIDRNK